MQRIKLYRQKAGLTQSELANMLGIDRSAVTKWENNISYPRFKLLPKLAKIFSCDVNDIFFTSDNDKGVYTQ